jgi:hypothetical protein
MPAPLSYQTFQGDGSSLNYPVAFPYLLREHVRLYVNYVVATGAFDLVLAPTVGFTWISDTEVQLTTAIGPSDTLSIVRGTPADLQLVEWEDASNITADALNIAQLQLLYILQEIADRGTITFGGTGVTQTVDIIDNLLSTRANAALSANQGRVLKDLIDSAGIGTNTIIDNLVSIRTDASLSANMGRALKALIDQLRVEFEDFKIDVDTRLDELETGGGGGGGDGGSNQDPPLEGNPIGTIVWLQRAPLSAPIGYIYCGGEEVFRNAYFQLFNAVGTTYGSGDGTTTFNLPLEANLTNPYGAGWRPFIKFGVRVGGGTGILNIFPPRVSGTELQGWERQSDLTWVARTTVTGLTAGGTRPWHVTSNGRYWVAFNDGSTTQPPPTDRFRINGNSWTSLGAFLSNVPGGAQRVYHARFSPDGTKLAVVLRISGATQITTVQIYNISPSTNAFTWASQYQTDASFPPVSAIVWTNDGKRLTLLNQEVAVTRGFMFFAVSSGGAISLLGQQSNAAVGVGAWLSYSVDGQWAAVSGSTGLGGSDTRTIVIYAVTGTATFNSVYSFTTSTNGILEFVEFSPTGFMLAVGVLGKIFYFNPTTQQLIGFPSGGITFDATGGGSAVTTSGSAITWLPGQAVPTFLWENKTYEVTNNFTEYRLVAAAANAPSGGLGGTLPYAGPIAVLAP